MSLSAIPALSAWHPEIACMNQLEVHVAMSATPMFWRQLWYLTQSLRRFGGEAGKTARVVAWLSPDQGIYDIDRTHPWLRENGIVTHWVASNIYERYWYYGTALARGMARHDADAVLWLDADTLVCGALDELVDEVCAHGEVRGLPAHVDVFASDPGAWERLFECIERPLLRECYPSGRNIYTREPNHPIPAYWNLGVIIGATEVMEKMGRELFVMLDVVNARLSTYFRCQVAVTLARTEVTHRDLDIRYNFPNDKAFERTHGRLIDDIRILHYLRCDQDVDKWRDFQSGGSVLSLLGRRRLRGSNLLLQKRLQVLPQFPEDPEAIGGWWSRYRRYLRALAFR